MGSTVEVRIGFTKPNIQCQLVQSIIFTCIPDMDELIMIPLESHVVTSAQRKQAMVKSGQWSRFLLLSTCIFMTLETLRFLVCVTPNV